MKTIIQSFSADLSWTENLAKQFGGRIDGNFIILPEQMQTGTRYFLDCGPGIVAYYIDAVYNKNFHFVQKNGDNDYVAIYYNLNEGKAAINDDGIFYDIGRWNYNIMIADGSLNFEYNVKAGSHAFALFVFIKKDKIKELLKNHDISFYDIGLITDPSKNTIIRCDRMSSKSYHLLNDLRKLKVGGNIFDLNFIGTVHMLISNYLEIMVSERKIIQTVDKFDLAAIIAAQSFLIEHLHDHFPSINYMANMAEMSTSKFKKLFRKITGITPNKFFMENKLVKAKELLSSKQLSITEIANLLSFSHSSYFTAKFSEAFGITPKAYIKQL